MSPYGGFLSHGGTPSHHPFLIGIFRNKNHPAIAGTSMTSWKPPYEASGGTVIKNKQRIWRRSRKVTWNPFTKKHTHINLGIYIYIYITPAFWKDSSTNVEIEHVAKFFNMFLQRDAEKTWNSHRRHRGGRSGASRLDAPQVAYHRGTRGPTKTVHCCAPARPEFFKEIFGAVNGRFADMKSLHWISLKLITLLNSSSIITNY